MVLMFNPVKFIEEVKIRPALYDAEAAKNQDRWEKMVLWKEIGAALFPDWQSCNKATIYDRVLQLQKKWRSLRDTYKRELRRRKMGSRGTHGMRKVYRHFKRLSFLGGFEGELSPTEYSEDDDKNCTLLLDSEDLKHADNANNDDDDDARSASVCDTPTPKKNKRRKRKRESTPSLQDAEEYEIPIPLFSSDIQDENDSDKFFLMSFLPEMKQLPVNIKMWARSQIANVMQEAVSSHYNNTTPRMSWENCQKIKDNSE